MLSTVGLDQTATSVYRFLLRSESATPKLIADQLGLSDDAVADALDTLKRFSMVWNCDDEDLMRPASPEYRLSELAAGWEAEALRRHEEIRGALTYINDLTSEFNKFRTGQLRGAMEVLGCADHTRLRIAELSSPNRDEIVSIHPGKQITDYIRIAEHWKGSSGDFVRPVRSLFPDSVIKHPERRKYVQLLTGWGLRLRTMLTVPGRMMLIGDHTAVLQAEAKIDSEASVVIHNPGIILILKDHFEQVWQHATTMDDAATDGAAFDHQFGALLNPNEQATLAMLSEGMTDEAIARKLDVSVRTVRRVIASLLEKLGARSRFEAAVLAAKRGWV